MKKKIFSGKKIKSLIILDHNNNNNNNNAETIA